MTVVIVGCGVVSPIGNGFNAFSKALFAGACGVRLEKLPPLGKVPLARVQGVVSIPGEDRSISLLRPCLAELQPVLQALQSVVPPQERGVFAATSKGSILQEFTEPGFGRKTFPSLWACAVAAFLAQQANACGPLGSSVGACATGLANILRAARSVESGECQFALAGSSEATLHPAYIASFLNLNAYSRTGSRPFDAEHSGFVAGEGAAVLAVTTLEIAQKVGLKPLAEVVSWAEGADAFHPVGIDVRGEVIATVGLKAWERAGKPEIQAVSCHGTATAANDLAEATAIGLMCERGLGKGPFCHSLKGATGHLMGAAGAVETVSALAMLVHQAVPPTVGLLNPAPGCEHLRFPRLTQQEPLVHLLKWSFGFGGHIASIILKSGNNSSS